MSACTNDNTSVGGKIGDIKSSRVRKNETVQGDHIHNSSSSNG